MLKYQTYGHTTTLSCECVYKLQQVAYINIVGGVFAKPNKREQVWPCWGPPQHALTRMRTHYKHETTRIMPKSQIHPLALIKHDTDSHFNLNCLIDNDFCNKKDYKDEKVEHLPTCSRCEAGC